MWTFGGSLTDENDQVTINSKETIEALKYGKELAATFIPGAASWLDPSNNKAFLAGEISATGNGISIYYAAKNSQDPDHARRWPRTSTTPGCRSARSASRPSGR